MELRTKLVNSRTRELVVDVDGSEDNHSGQNHSENHFHGETPLKEKAAPLEGAATSN